MFSQYHDSACTLFQLPKSAVLAQNRQKRTSTPVYEHPVEVGETQELLQVLSARGNQPVEGHILLGRVQLGVLRIGQQVTGPLGNHTGGWSRSSGVVKK